MIQDSSVVLSKWPDSNVGLTKNTPTTLISSLYIGMNICSSLDKPIGSCITDSLLIPLLSKIASVDGLFFNLALARINPSEVNSGMIVLFFKLMGFR